MCEADVFDKNLNTRIMGLLVVELCKILQERRPKDTCVSFDEDVPLHGRVLEIRPVYHW